MSYYSLLFLNSNAFLLLLKIKFVTTTCTMQGQISEKSYEQLVPKYQLSQITIQLYM